MKKLIKSNTRCATGVPLYKAITKAIFILVIWCTGTVGPLQAQVETYTKPGWWFGVAAGANFNSYDGSTLKLTDAFTAPVAFTNGHGIGLYLAPLLEYHFPESALGIMFQVGYDGRSSDYDTQAAPCNCPADLSTTLGYLTIEPSIRIAPFHGNFYLYGGPRFAFNVKNSFTYREGINPDFPDVNPTPDVNGEMSDMRSSLVSMQIGAGYDIPLTMQNRETQFVLSPFIAFHPKIGQSPRDIERWDVTTLRVGAALKFGHGRLIPQPDQINVTPPEPAIRFTVNSPENKQNEQFTVETFPLRNYIFFDSASTEIPSRYVTLRKQDVENFREEELDMFKPANLSGRADRQMVVYYNIMNILGERMIKDPSADVTLVGSSENGLEDARAMALTVKQYLISTFGIANSRIMVESREKPENPSLQPGGTLELSLLRAGDRRVSIESKTPGLLMEYYNGPNAPLKPVQIKASKEAPKNSYITFDTEGAKKEFTSWSVEVKDENGKVQNFGPYTDDKISIPGNSILGTHTEGDYVVTMVGQAKDGRVIRREVPMHAVLWNPAAIKDGMRYSILYEFNESETIAMYEKYITEVVTPKIPQNGKVMVRGYTDIIGDAANNLKLSLARANDVKSILEASLAMAGRTDVTIDVKGLGEDESTALFANKYPEERFYNRTVVIDILPVN